MSPEGCRAAILQLVKQVDKAANRFGVASAAASDDVPDLGEEIMWIVVMPEGVKTSGDLETLGHAVEGATGALERVEEKHKELMQTNHDLQAELDSMNSSCDELLTQKQTDVITSQLHHPLLI